MKKELKKKGLIVLNVIDNIKWKKRMLQFHNAYTINLVTNKVFQRFYTRSNIYNFRERADFEKRNLAIIKVEASQLKVEASGSLTRSFSFLRDCKSL